MPGRGRGGRSNTWTRDGANAQGGRAQNAGPVGVRRRDVLNEDLVVERPAWALSCYGPTGGQPNLLGGDTSFEELRACARATAARTGDARAVHALAREYVEAKRSDAKSILSFPENQLREVLDKVERGQIAPAGAQRVIEGDALGTSAGLNAGASPFAPTGQGAGFGGGFGGVGGFQPAATQTRFGTPAQPAVGTPAGQGFAPQPIVGAQFGGGGSASPFGGGVAASSSPFGGHAMSQVPLTPDPNDPNSPAWCAPTFTFGAIPDEPPSAAFIR